MHKNLEIRFYLKLKNKHLKSRLYNKQHQAKAAALGFAALFENCIIELFQHWNQNLNYLKLQLRLKQELFSEWEQNIDVKNVFYVFIIFIKNTFFNGFYFLERFLFSSDEIFYPTEPAKIQSLTDTSATLTIGADCGTIGTIGTIGK